MRTRVRHPIVVCEAHRAPTGAVTDILLDEGFDVHHALDDETLIEAAATHRPFAVVYVLAHDLTVDLALLQLVRRVFPDIPLVLVCGPRNSIRARVEPVHPVHVAHAPLDAHALGDAVRRAIAKHAKRERTRQRARVPRRAHARDSPRAVR